MRWEGVNEFFSELNDMGSRLRDGATAHNLSAAKRARQYANVNFGLMRIGLVTGRSRALYAARQETIASPGGTFAAYAGYTSWPSDVEFYPAYLNFGTSWMSARPYHDLAIEQARAWYFREMGSALNRAFSDWWTGQ